MNARFLFLITCLFFSLDAFAAKTAFEQQATRYVASIKKNPEQLAKFLELMPKGGDLHNHKNGATFPTNLLKYAQTGNFCVDRHTLSATVNPTCAPEDLLQTAIKDPTFRDALIDAWSMRHFKQGKESGHDHFFATFSKVGALTDPYKGEILSEIVERAAKQNELYIELMSTLDGNQSGKLGRTLGWNDDFAVMREKLLANNFAVIVASMSTNINEEQTKMRTLLACDSASPQPGCDITVRYQYQVLREQAPEMVFAQLLAGFEAASKDSRIVALNMVQPEDGKISMQDYKLQMKMVGYLHKLYPRVPVSLHAGELNDSLVSPEGLTFHIKDAVNVAKANRIGHGVDIAYEDEMQQTLTTMAKDHVMVEINLTSNDYILNVRGKNHPLPLYLQNGVPVALSTDDEGVSLENLTKQYERAVDDFGFDYLTLKKFSRNSLTYAFVEGNSLWIDYEYQQVTYACARDQLGSKNPSKDCAGFLAKNKKAALQWELEKRFIEFEGSVKRLIS